MRKSVLFIGLFLLTVQYHVAQTNKVSFKFNFGSTFSKPQDDLAKSYGQGNSLQPALSMEAAYMLTYSKNTKFGVKLAGVAGYDMSNILAHDALSQVKVSIPNVRARIYPFSYDGKLDDAFEKVAPEGLPFMLEIPVWIAIYSSINSLHFDYGTGFATLTEKPFIDEYTFAETQTTRTMTYTGWGVQPQIYTSESEKWVWNAIFDFGKYKWTNNAGGTSSIKSNMLGFGFSYKF
ncbi:hypothetical protein [Flavobacterium croceum]|uniref:Outer membrane protein with beta-barrel domain n=1 Tax=Flavobacterium croceum DSM 17960 TaxID=1121886 RepID=A0A2S4NA60_9FLAO|nr:hypothetical protein [Flavobacterium croceum]POS02572.1 hypothetical protein Q361_10381 [Flavobacterium croceum DSM 17960]